MLSISSRFKSQSIVDSKVLTPRALGKWGTENVVDSKMMTPAMGRNADQ
jgi:hypothetical protein